MRPIVKAMAIDSFAYERECIWRDALVRFNYDFDGEPELITDDSWSAYLEFRASNGDVDGLTLKVREFWEDSGDSDPRLPTSRGYSLLYCFWHAQIPHVGEYRICVDPLREDRDHPLMHMHEPGRVNDRLRIEAIGVPEQWLTAVARFLP